LGTHLHCRKDWSDPWLSRRTMELMSTEVMLAIRASHVGRRGVFCDMIEALF
jgi:hypothetical protein